MQHKEGTFSGFSGTKIFHQQWLPENVRAVLVIAHGLGEHSGRYAHLAAYLVEKGFAVYALDHRGHGRSEGRRGHVLGFHEYLEDLDQFFKMAAKENQGKKIFLMGHSLGGLMATLYALDHQEEMQGLVISSAAYAVNVEVGAVKLALGRFFSKHKPELSMGNGIDPKNISRDPEVVKAYIADPLVHDRVSARWYTSFTAAIEDCNKRAGELKIPALIMQSGADSLVSPQGAKDFFESAGPEDKTLKIWDGFYHEMFNEPEKDKVYAYAIEWLEKHLS